MWREGSLRVVASAVDASVARVMQAVAVRHGIGLHFAQRRVACFDLLRRGMCDLLVIDLDGASSQGLEMLRWSRRSCPWVSSVVLVGQGNVLGAVAAMKAGATDCIEKPEAESYLTSVIQEELDWPGRTRVALTPIQRKVLHLIVVGRTSQEIAQILDRSKRTIDVCRQGITEKLGIGSTAGLVRWALSNGLMRMRFGANRVFPRGVRPSHDYSLVLKTRT